MYSIDRGMESKSYCLNCFFDFFGQHFSVFYLAKNLSYAFSMMFFYRYLVYQGISVSTKSFKNINWLLKSANVKAKRWQTQLIFNNVFKFGCALNLTATLVLTPVIADASSPKKALKLCKSNSSFKIRLIKQ